MKWYSELYKKVINTYRQQGMDRVFLLGVRYMSWRLNIHRRVGSLPRPLSAVIFRISKMMMLLILRVFRWLKPNKYTDANPYKQLWTDPDEITHTTSGAARRRGWVQAGEWDRQGTPFLSRTYPKAINQRYGDRRPWEETILADKFDDTKQLSRHCDKIECLCDAIRQDGYHSQKQLLEKNPEAAWSGLNDAMHPLANEIAVDIGRNGELLWNMCGQHRLAIAKILEIDRIPVQVFRRHSEWQKIRDRARRGEEIPEKFSDHPDLADIFEHR